MVSVAERVKRKQEQQRKRKAEEAADKGKPSKKNRKAGNPNTGPIFYFSNSIVKRNCKKEEAAIKRECGTKNGKRASRNAADNAQPSKTSKLGAIADKVKDGVTALDNGAKKVYGYPDKPGKDNAWIDDHCKGLWVKPGGGPKEAPNIDKFKQQLEKIKDGFKADAMEVAKQAGWKVAEKAAEKAVTWGEHTVAREGAALLTLEIPVVGELAVIGATLWSIADGIASAYDVGKMAIKEGPKILGKVQELMGQANKISDILNSETGMNDIMADMMAAVAEANPCIKARKCSLVPYEETKEAKKQAQSGKGCCPGQTGHHLLPDAMFREPNGEKTGSGRDGKPTLKCWDNYTEGGAPTICLEGTGNNATNGSHGAAHALTKGLLRKYQKPTVDGKPALMNYTDARDDLAGMVERVYGCSKKCITAQLDAYYKKAYSCGDPTKDGKVVPNGGNGGTPGDVAKTKIGNKKKKP